MRKVALAVIFTFVSAPALAQSVNVQLLQKSFKQWQPLGVSEEGNIITITMNEARITPELYDFAAEQGVCSPLWLDDKKATYLIKTKEIRVLNKFNSAGYVLETPRAICNEAGKTQPEQSKILILSKTHLFMGK